MSNPLNAKPCWKKHFPVRQSEEHELSRRAFSRSLGLVSLVTLLGSALGATRRRSSSHRSEMDAAIPIARVDELPIGAAKPFRDPRNEDPCILVRLAEDSFAAFSQSCTHLMCPVHFQADKQQLVCPCHEGYFSAVDGRVLAGPPKRPLTRYPVEIRGGVVYVKPAEENS